MKKLKIAFDGPVASGKSTIAKAVAKRLGYIYIDTGAMYRAVTWKAHILGKSFKDDEELIDVARRCPVEFIPDSGNSQGYRIVIDGDDVTSHLCSPEVNNNVSIVAKISEIRRILVSRQKVLAGEGGVVMAGRDITTVVMPDAEIKIYLTASEEERAQRRFLEHQEKREAIDIHQVRENVKLRDTIDSSRADSPLLIADDAYVLDSTGKSIDNVVEETLGLVHKYQSEGTPSKG
ncbi:MAG: (d)CMP kinase [Vulcanimicrobiota bacterium]